MHTNCIPSVIVAGCCLFGSNAVSAQLTGDPELFVVVADAWRSNFERIETWQGEVLIEVTYLGKESLKRHGSKRTTTARFWYSRDQNALMRIVDTHLGKTPDGKPDVRRQTVLRLPDAVHSLRMTYPAREKTEARIATVLINSPETDRVAFTTEDFDPLIWLRCEPFFDVDQRMHQVYDHLDEYRKLWAENPGVDQNTLEKNGTVVRYVTLMGAEDQEFEKVEFTFDIARGGLPVDAHWTSSRPDSGSRLTIEPVLISGAWVPTTAKYHYRANLATERIIAVTFTKNLVNEPLPDAIFDPDQMELVAGDPIIDARTGERKRFGVNASPTTPVVSKSSRLHMGTILVSVITAVVAGFVIAMAVRRQRHD